MAVHGHTRTIWTWAVGGNRKRGEKEGEYDIKKRMSVGEKRIALKTMCQGYKVKWNSNKGQTSKNTQRKMTKAERKGKRTARKSKIWTNTGRVSEKGKKRKRGKDHLQRHRTCSQDSHQ